MSEHAPSIVLAGGGTGGHVIPALALAEELVFRGCEVRFIGTRGRLEERLVPAAGFRIDYIDVRPLTGKGLLQRGLGVASVPAAVARSISLIRKERPDVVMGVGGYVAGPVVLGAVLLRIPTALLEQNATLGLTNRLLRPFVKKAFVAYDGLKDVFRPGVGAVTGNPLKPSIVAVSEKRRTRKKNAPVQVLVMGGSQGAGAIDERVPRALAEAGVAGRVKVTHQCGKNDGEAVAAAYRSAGIAAEVVPFITDTAAAYYRTDLVVARSGATTVSELAAMGLPSVLLPYPHHADRQQEKNAQPLKDAGAALVLDENNTGVGEMAKAIVEFVDDDARRKRAGKAALALAKKDAAKDIADALFRLAGRR